jgi:hypothetical protein
MPPSEGLIYPLIGFTVTTPSAPLPATTLLGASVLVTLMVNCGVTERTVNGSAGVVTVEFALVPVIVMLYSIVVVSIFVVTVAVAVPGTFTELGLIRQLGGSMMELSDGLTWQLRFTVPVNPVVEPIWTCEEAVPVGEIASGLNGAASKVNSCADAVDDKAKTRATVKNHSARILPHPKNDFTLESDHSDLNMDGFWFN